MSTKSTIFLTNESEHFYEELSYENEQFKNGEYLGPSICMEFDKKNIRIDVNDGFDLCITIHPGSDLYNKLKEYFK